MKREGGWREMGKKTKKEKELSFFIFLILPIFNARG